MGPGEVTEWAKAIAIVGGVALGCFAVFSPSWVWFRKQIWKWGSGALMLGCGTMLILAPAFRNVSFVVDTQKFELKLNQLEAQVKAATDSLKETSALVTQLASAPTPSSTALAANVEKQTSALAAKFDDVSKWIEATRQKSAEDAQANATFKKDLDTQIAELKSAAERVEASVLMSTWMPGATTPSSKNLLQVYKANRANSTDHFPLGVGPYVFQPGTQTNTWPTVEPKY